MRLKPLGEDGQGLSPPWPVKLVLCMAPFIVWVELCASSPHSPLTLPISPCPSPFPPACPITFSLSEVTALTCSQTGGQVSPPLCPRLGCSDSSPKGAVSGCTAPKTQCEALSTAIGPLRVSYRTQRHRKTPQNSPKKARVVTRDHSSRCSQEREVSEGYHLDRIHRGPKLSGILEISLFWDSRWLELRVSSG